MGAEEVLFVKDGSGGGMCAEEVPTAFVRGGAGIVTGDTGAKGVGTGIVAGGVEAEDTDLVHKDVMLSSCSIVLALLGNEILTAACAF